MINFTLMSFNKMKFSLSTFFIFFIFVSFNKICFAEKNYIEGFYLNREESIKIYPIKINSSKILPNDLIIIPGIYNVFGKVYNFQKEGLYRVSKLFSENK